MPNTRVLRFPDVVDALRARSRAMTREERDDFDAANSANVRPLYRCAGGCGVLVRSSPALCLSCAAHSADAPGVGAMGDER